MKKLTTLAACLLLAAVTHAASVGWTIAGATAYAGGNYNVFLIGANGVTSLSQITALVAGGMDVSSFAWDSGTVASNGSASKAAASSGKTIEYVEGGSTADNTWKAFAVIWDAANENVSWTSTASTTLANNSTSKTFIFGNQSSNLAANNVSLGGGGDVPEPTSGLLLLVGGAMLALRRKQK